MEFVKHERVVKEYTLKLDYTDLHSLYHMMLCVSKEQILTDVEEEFFQALREHA